MNRISFESAARVLDGLSKELFNQSLFFKPFSVKPENVSNLDWDKIVNRAKHIVERYVFPSYKRLSVFLLGKYLTYSRKEIAASSLPHGEEYYNACLRFHTTSDLTAARIHDIGLKEVERITHRMEKIRREVRFNGDLKMFRRYLRNNATFGFEKESDILKRYNEIQKIVNGTLKKYFQRLPKLPYVIKPVPKEVAPSYPLGYYENVSPNGKLPGIFYANTYNPTVKRKYVALALFLHEAVPGHHLQTSLTYEHGSSLSFRKFVGVDGSFYQVPAHFAMNSAYIEGWGLYAEYLGEEMGLYADPYDLFGRLSSEMLRACRLVIDTGIHLYGWSRSSSVKYLEDNTAEDKSDISAEVDRYITWPGQACAYKIGEMKILKLRGECERSLGKKFNLGRFHDFIVTMGAVPLDILEEQIHYFIKRERTNKA